MMSGEFRTESEVEVAFDFSVDSGVAEYIGAKSWAYDRFAKDFRWRMNETEGRALFSFKRYPDALMFALYTGGVIRAVGAA
ncbi:MAG TPA: hypothetical protein DCY26_03355 [Hyphomonas sp.]|nr:hypothetical protein [Hyphomonas sp.]